MKASRQRHAAGPCQADHVRRAALHPADGRPHLGSRFDQYFTQQLLPDYIEQYGMTGTSSTTRAAISRSRTASTVPLGTLQVREYLANVRGFKLAEL